MSEEEGKTSVYQAEANCRAGTISLTFSVLPPTDDDPETKVEL
jgi:hypothetical protein